MKLKPLVAALGMRPDFWMTKFGFMSAQAWFDERRSHVEGFSHRASSMGRLKLAPCEPGIHTLTIIESLRQLRVLVNEVQAKQEVRDGDLQVL